MVIHEQQGFGRSCSIWGISIRACKLIGRIVIRACKLRIISPDELLALYHRRHSRNRVVKCTAFVSSFSTGGNRFLKKNGVILCVHIEFSLHQENRWNTYLRSIFCTVETLTGNRYQTATENGTQLSTLPKDSRYAVHFFGRVIFCFLEFRIHDYSWAIRLRWIRSMTVLFAASSIDFWKTQAIL